MRKEEITRANQQTLGHRFTYDDEGPISLPDPFEHGCGAYVAVSGRKAATALPADWLPKVATRTLACNLLNSTSATEKSISANLNSCREGYAPV